MKYRIWSWDKPHSTWLEVAQGTRREMTDALDRKRRAAARLLPDARFTMTSMSEVPTEPPADEEVPA